MALCKASRITHGSYCDISTGNRVPFGKLSHGQAADARQHLVHIQQERRAKMGVIQLFIAVVLEDPAHPRHRRGQQGTGCLALTATRQHEDPAPVGQLGFVEENGIVPAVYVSSFGGELGFVFRPRLGDSIRIKVVQAGPLADLRTPIQPTVPDLPLFPPVFAQFGFAGAIADIGGAVEFDGAAAG